MTPLSIGVACHPGFGGSGIVATELGLAMASRGHDVHFICVDTPRRLDQPVANVTVHLAEAKAYPVFETPPYALALCSTIVNVAREHGLDLVHAHYAIPHAVTAWMAREILGGALKIVTTLHGTDITLIGEEPGYYPVVRHSIEMSDAVTAPSRFLRDETHRRFELDTPIDVIPNFVSTETFRPLAGSDRPELRKIFGEDGPPMLVHVSNFRSVKRPIAVVEAFAMIVAETPARLLLIGDGPERAATEDAVARLGLAGHCRSLGSRHHIESLLRECALFLLPSCTESFGLAALEASASGVPVVASAVGGLPEVIQHTKTGILVPRDDLEQMAAEAVALLQAPQRREAMAQAARADVLERFERGPLVERYEALYRRVMGEET